MVSWYGAARVASWNGTARVLPALEAFEAVAAFGAFERDCSTATRRRFGADSVPPVATGFVVGVSKRILISNARRSVVLTIFAPEHGVHEGGGVIHLSCMALVTGAMDILGQPSQVITAGVVRVLNLLSSLGWLVAFL